MTRLVVAAALAFLVTTTAGLRAQTSSDTPDGVVRALVVAMYSNDVAAYNRLTLPDPRRARLTSNGKVNQEKLDEIQRNPGLLQIKIVRPFLHRGRPATADSTGEYPVTTTVLYRAVAGGQPVVVTLVKQPEGWRVDIRWWLAMTDLMTADPVPGTPDYAARALIFSVLGLNRRQAAQYALPDASMDLLFAYAPSQREPSGVLEATAAEMPIVELRPGEFCELPGRRVVEGSAQPDLKVLLGQYGIVEMPFVVRRIGSDWRVEALPYFLLLNR